MPIDPRIVDLVMQAEELQEQGRAIDLAILCAGHPELQDEVRRRLQGLRGFARWIDTIAQPAPPTAPRPTIPGYELEEELGRGGMGVVYKARQLALDRVVAIKMILPRGSLGERERQRFRTEAEAVARLRHPNIVQVYDIGEVEGRPYLVLEYVEGTSLDRQLADRAQPARQAASLVCTLARALQAAHEQQVIHRDLKPANVLLALPRGEGASGTDTPRASGTAGGSGEGSTQSPVPIPKVADFGLAKRLDRGEGITRSQEVLGTPSYMAPEQVGSNPSVGPGVDVYGLGGVLYKMLTGRPPFVGETLEDILLQVVRDDPAPPSRLAPRIPTDLESICLKCLEKEPRRRYLSAAELADDLDRFLDGQPVRALPLTWWRRASKWARRRPAIASLSALVVAGFLGLLVAGGLLYDAHLKATAAQRLTDEQKNAIGHLEGERGRLEGERDRLNKERGQLDHDLAKERKLLGQVRQQKDETQEEGRRIRYAIDMRRGLLAWEGNQINRLASLLNQNIPKPGQAELRSFEFGFLSRLIGQWDVPMARNEWPLLDVASSPEGGTVATIDLHNGVALWDTASAGLIRRLASPGRVVLEAVAKPQIAYSADSSWLAAVTSSGEVRLWELTGRPRRHPLPRNTPATALAFAPHSTTLALAALDGAVWFYDPVNRREVGRPWVPVAGRGEYQRVVSLAWSADGRSLAASRREASFSVWDQKTGEERTARPGETHAIERVAFSPDGRTLALGMRGPEGELILWDTLTWGPRRQFPAHPAGVTAVGYSRDGSQLATGGRDGMIRLWNGRTGAPLHRLRGMPGVLSGLAFDPTGSVLAACSGEGGLRFWPANLRQEHDLLAPGPSRTVAAMAFTPDSKVLLTGGPGILMDQVTELKAWEVGDGVNRLKATLQGPISEVNAIALSGDGRWLATVHNQPLSPSSPAEVRLWDLLSQRLHATLRGHRSVIYSLSFSLDGKSLASASGNLGVGKEPGQVLVWDVGSGTLRQSVRRGPELFSSAQFLPDGGALAIGSVRMVGGKLTGRVEVCELATGKNREVWSGTDECPTALTIPRTGDAILAATGNPNNPRHAARVRRWSWPDGKRLPALDGIPATVFGLSVDDSGRHLAAGGGDGKLRLWDLSAEKPVARVFSTPHPWVTGVSVSANGSRVAAASASPGLGGAATGAFSVWDREKGTLLARFPSGHVGVVARSIDGSRLAAGDHAGLVRLYDPARKGVLRTLIQPPAEKAPHRRALTAMALSPNGRLLATGDRDGYLFLWDQRTGKVRQELPRQDAAVSALAFHPNGRSLAIGTGGLLVVRQPGQVRVWDLSEEKFGPVLRKHPTGIPALAYARRGALLAVGLDAQVEGGKKGGLVLLDPTTGAERDRARSNLVDVAVLAVTPDGNTIAAGGQGRGLVAIWDLAQGRIRTLEAHTDAATAVSFTPDGRTLATGGRDQAVRLWQVSSGDELFTLPGRHGPVTALSFSPDGLMLAVGTHPGLKGEVRLWRARK